MISPLYDKFVSLADSFFDETVNIRRHLHCNPELSFHEKETSAFIAEKLKEFEIGKPVSVAGTGLMCDIEGQDPERGTVVLRADIDALPIQEAGEHEYKSCKPGIMHACGHDAHTSNLIAAGRLLSKHRKEWKGRVRLIFQPAEERAPGGALQMIDAGVLENPEPLAVIGQHVSPDLETGHFAFRSGKFMASADELYLKIIGKGGHAAMPETFRDPISTAAQLISTLQQVVSRRADPKTPAVLSFGNISSPGGSTNVIPNEVVLEGTFRTYDEKFREEAHELIRNISTAVCESMGLKAEVQIRRGYPALHNDESLTAKLSKTASELLGESKVHEWNYWTAAEDFAYYALQKPSVFYLMGVRNETKGITSGLHTPTFDIDEEAFRKSAPLMAALALSVLE